MDKEKLKNLLKDVRDNKVSIDEALHHLRSLPYEDMGFAKIDTHRHLRRGFPEVIFCKGKTIEQIIAIVDKFSNTNPLVMATKADKNIYEALKSKRDDVNFYEKAGIILVGKVEKKKPCGNIIVVTAGTADIPVAEEAIVTAETMGVAAERLYDVGVAGVHRLFDNMGKFSSVDVIVVVAGMEGALASIIGGMVDKPVIAVPTSVGYGASFDGLAALLSMLNSCAPGVTVVNIDNGFGAGYFAGMISRMGGEK